MGFKDPQTAISARDALTRLMVSVLDQERPPYRYGTVDFINPDGRTCAVKFDPADDAITVTMGAVQPTSVGQVVRVSGRPGDLFISDVIGKAATTDAPSVNLVAPSPFTFTAEIHAVHAWWAVVPEASKYQIELADDASFTVNVRSFDTVSRQFRLGDLPAGQSIYARVRGMTGGGVGPWSVTKSVVVQDFHEQQFSDGTPPESSPQPVITGTLGWLMAEWVATPNPDLVTYEIHVSTVSGFTPSSSTKLGETTSTFYSVAALPSGGRLAYDTTYFIRLIAKDADGAAPVGAQGSGQIERVDTGDAGNIGDTGDGRAPSASPAVGKVTAGIGFLYVQWEHVTNNDALTYDVHVSTTPGFTPSPNTLVARTPSTYTFIRNQGPGEGSASLQYGVTYYIKLWARDYDGYASAPGREGFGATVRAVGEDVDDSSISADKLVEIYEREIIKSATQPGPLVELPAFTRASIAYLNKVEVASGVPRYPAGSSIFIEEGTTNLLPGSLVLGEELKTHQTVALGATTQTYTLSGQDVLPVDRLNPHGGDASRTTVGSTYHGGSA